MSCCTPHPLPPVVRVALNLCVHGRGWVYIYTYAVAVNIVHCDWCVMVMNSTVL